MSKVYERIEPSIARFIEVLETPRDSWIAMEFVEGEPLSAILEREGSLPPWRVTRLIT